MAEMPTWVYRVLKGLLKAWALLWFRCRFYGADHVPAEGGCILAANHASYLDPPMVGMGVKRRPVHFLARDTLFGRGLRRWIFTRIMCVPIDRTRGDVAALKRGLEVLKHGGLLGLFPEGTRTLDGQLQTPKGGIGFLIAKAGVPVVPIYIDGSFKAFPKNAKWVKPVKVTAHYGQPIMPEEFASLGRGREAYEEIARLVMARIAALKPETGMRKA